MFYVYLIQSKTNDMMYVGCTSDLKRRLVEHNHGKVTATKSYIPYDLIYYEAFKSKKDALIREKKLKHHGQGLRRLKERLTNSMSK